MDTCDDSGAFATRRAAACCGFCEPSSIGMFTVEVAVFKGGVVFTVEEADVPVAVVYGTGAASRERISPAHIELCRDEDGAVGGARRNNALKCT